MGYTFGLLWSTLFGVYRPLLLGYLAFQDLVFFTILDPMSHAFCLAPSRLPRNPTTLELLDQVFPASLFVWIQADPHHSWCDVRKNC